MIYFLLAMIALLTIIFLQVITIYLLVDDLSNY